MFHKDFLIGAATAAHQVEGNNIHSDLWVMENLPHSTYKEPSLDAVDHYNRYREDIRLMKEAGLNAYRFTIEWARVEPEEGQFEAKEIDHYREKLLYCHEMGITPIVTLHHFSSPFWLTKDGGWENEATVERFANYVAYVIEALGEQIPYICTINEANMGVQITKLIERMKKGAGQGSQVQVGLNTDIQENMMRYFQELGEAFGTDPLNIHEFVSPKTPKGNEIILAAHQRAREVIKAIRPEIKVGITLSLHDNQALPGGEGHVEKAYQEDFHDFLPALQEDDFIGLQNYSRQIFDENGMKPLEETARKTKMGYEFYPEAIGNVVRYVSNYWSKEIMVTENGISTANDEERKEYIERALVGIHDCIKAGIPVSGYMHWSLLDNFEWQLGYSQTFGLIAVDRTTQKRLPKESLYFLGSYKKDVAHEH